MAMQITFEDVSFTYSANTPFASEALKQVSLTIPDKSYTAIIGNTGSGKSTLTKLFNGLLLPTDGQIIVGDTVVTPETSKKQVKNVRKKMGMVFQFPEAQLFEESVIKDVMFGPKNFGDDEETARRKAGTALERVGISDALYDQSPFDLSGGQMRRVAIAGVLAMEPEVLILDEPTAGLDPKGQDELMTIFNDLYATGQMTVILVTHQMNDVASWSNHVIVMDHGTCVFEGQPTEVFSDQEWLEHHHLALPDTLAFREKLFANGMSLPKDALPLTVDQLADQIAAQLMSDTQGEAVQDEG